MVQYLLYSDCVINFKNNNLPFSLLHPDCVVGIVEIPTLIINNCIPWFMGTVQRNLCTVCVHCSILSSYLEQWMWWGPTTSVWWKQPAVPWSSWTVPRIAWPSLQWSYTVQCTATSRPSAQATTAQQSCYHTINNNNIIRGISFKDLTAPRYWLPHRLPFLV